MGENLPCSSSLAQWKACARVPAQAWGSACVCLCMGNPLVYMDVQAGQTDEEETPYIRYSKSQTPFVCV